MEINMGKNMEKNIGKNIGALFVLFVLFVVFVVLVIYFLRIPVKESLTCKKKRKKNSKCLIRVKTSSRTPISNIDILDPKLTYANRRIDYLKTNFRNSHNDLKDIKRFSTSLDIVEWMGTLLDVKKYRDGSIIPEVTDNKSWENATKGAWCYYNNNPVHNKNRKLYNLHAVNDLKGLVPLGYSIPTYDEFENLPDQYKKLYHGYRNKKGTFMNKYSMTYLWTTTDASGFNAKMFSKTGATGKVRRKNANGYSVRCIKDKKSRTYLISSLETLTTLRWMNNMKLKLFLDAEKPLNSTHRDNIINDLSGAIFLLKGEVNGTNLRKLNKLSRLYEKYDTKYNAKLSDYENINAILNEISGKLSNLNSTIGINEAAKLIAENKDQVAKLEYNSVSGNLQAGQNLIG